MLEFFSSFFKYFGPEYLTWQQVVMWIIGGVLIFLAIKKEMEPTLLLPMGFGAILVNLPASGAIDQFIGGTMTEGPLSTLFKAGINNELFPLILFIGIGAMIDFGPLLSNPKLMFFGAAAQFGIFFTISSSPSLKTQRLSVSSARQTALRLSSFLSNSAPTTFPL